MDSRPEMAGRDECTPRVVQISLAGGAPVMATGIVSTALDLDGQRVAAGALLALACGVMAGVLGVLAIRAAVRPAGLAEEASRPASLTVVAAFCVLGTRLTRPGTRAVGAALLVCAAAAWLVLLPAVLRNRRRPARGETFLVVVATEAIAILAATLGRAYQAGWLVALSLPMLAGGLALYAVVGASFDWGEVRRGRGDQWVAGGALAISALAAATAAAASRATGVTGPGALTGLAVAIWATAMLWLPLLVAGELRRPRARLDPPRWSTVFPLGMYAAAAHVVGRQSGHPWIAGFGTEWTWVAAIAWALVGAAALGRAARWTSRPSG